MEVDMLHAAGSALLIILDWHRLGFLFAGVCMGLSLGLLPGIGGVAGTALLLPFTYNMDAHAAFGMLLGLGSTTTTADPISAILFGAPGHAASAATTLDGYPMTRRGEAGRALGASYMSALIGGLFGAANDTEFAQKASDFIRAGLRALTFPDGATAAADNQILIGIRLDERHGMASSSVSQNTKKTRGGGGDALPKETPGKQRLAHFFWNVTEMMS